MSQRLRYLHLDVFTNRAFGGNQLAVFTDARGVTADLMQLIAREMAFSESTFILPAERADTDVRMRIFTPGTELPMAGHPTVGSAFALAHDGTIPPGRARWVFGLGVGPTPVDLEWDDGVARFAWMTQGRPAFGPVVYDAAAVAQAVGLAPEDIGTGTLRVQEVSCGLPFLLVPLSTRAAVDRAEPSALAIAKLAVRHKLQAEAVMVFTLQQGNDDATVYSRMFAPALGVVEDPATGSASGPLGCYLVRYDAVRPGQAGAIVNLQGVKMGRPSSMHIAIGLSPQGDITRVQVGGEAVLVGQGELRL